MLTERAKRRIDSQQLCNFTALDKQTKHELMVNKRRLMLQSRQRLEGRWQRAGNWGVRKACLPYMHMHMHMLCVACGVDALGARAALRTLGALCTLTLCPHQAATHTRHGVRGPQRRGHG